MVAMTRRTLWTAAALLALAAATGCGELDLGYDTGTYPDPGNDIPYIPGTNDPGPGTPADIPQEPDEGEVSLACSTDQECETRFGPGNECRIWICEVPDGATTGTCTSSNQCPCLSNADCLVYGNLCDGLYTCVRSVQPFVCELDLATVATPPTSPGECVESLCNPENGRWEQVRAADDTECDDMNPCTRNTRCLNGACVVSGTPTEWLNEACNDADDCTIDDCTVIDATRFRCEHFPRNCDDGDLCTIDRCTDGTCEHVLKEGTDSDNCTIDTCDPATGEFSVSPKCPDIGCLLGTCDSADGSCTWESLYQGACDDLNPCTQDECDPLLGACTHDTATLENASCEDGSVCTTLDVCASGVCIATDTSSCNPCSSLLQVPTLRLATFWVTAGGHPEDGLNVDGQETCSPEAACSAGVDNNLGPIVALLDGGVQDALDQNSAVVLFRVIGDATPGTPFSLGVLDGSYETCGESPCYRVKAHSLNHDCNSAWVLADATVTDYDSQTQTGTLVAGGPNSAIRIRLPIPYGEQVVELTLRNARIRASATLSFEGGAHIVGLTGIMAGAVNKNELLANAQKLDPAWLPVPLEELLDLLDLMLVPDIDFDGDGVAEAVSLSAHFTTEPVVVDSTLAQ